MNSNHIFNEYCKYKNKYCKEYGPQTIILMQVGSFYEIYAVINDEIQLGEIDIYNICQNLLGIVVTKRNKKIPEVSLNNYLQAGVGVDYISKYINILLNNNYTIIIVDQITQKPNVERGVTKIISPGTSINSYNSDDSNYLMAIYIEDYSTTSNQQIVAGISVIDVSTGKCYLHNIENNLDTNYWIDEISRYIHFYNPKEYLFQTKSFDLTNETIINNWDINHNSIQINHYSDSSYTSITYQNEILSKVFQIKSTMTPIEYFNLELKTALRNSFIYLLEYINGHTVDILNNIDEPEEINDINHLSLTSNSIRQLNVINNYSYYKGLNESLLSICNHCQTPMGRRMLKYRLMYPSLNSELLNKRYNLVSLYREEEFYKVIQKDLHKIIDLERIVRKMGLFIISPNEFFNSYLSYEYINKVIENINNNKIISNHYSSYNHSISTYKAFYKKVTNIFNFDNFTIYGLQRSYFNYGLYKDLDELDNEYDVTYNILLLISNKLSTLFEKYNKTSNKKRLDNLVKLDYNEKYNWYIYCTKNRAKTLQDIINKLKKEKTIIEVTFINTTIHLDLSDISIKIKDSSNVFLLHPIIKEQSDKLLNIHKQLINYNSEYWNKTIIQLYNEFSVCLLDINKYISEIDVDSNNAYISIQNNYVRPTLDTNAGKSYIEAFDIRHPIVEKINKSCEYITNDISLGKGNTDGILLFGTNACGKSTLMKSIGLCVIMAQAGLYVPCSRLIYKPYTQLFTRILNNDNMFKSQSTFAVEISELRCILKCSDENSLILGDELCSGTETLSALSIVSTSIKHMIRNNSSFILTSHLHQLNGIDCITDLTNLKIFHLKIDIEDGLLIYNRKLVEGPGPSVYGLKVCEAMGLSSDFINQSKLILSKLENKPHTIINNQTSIYNSNVFMDECKVCSKPSEETHHIKEQILANSNNHIDHFHKNNDHNLVPLCKDCHLKVTHGNLIIKGYKETTNGIILEYNYSNSIRKKKKFDDKIDIILKYKSIYNNSINQCIQLLELKEGITISKPVLRNIINGSY